MHWYSQIMFLFILKHFTIQVWEACHLMSDAQSHFFLIFVDDKIQKAYKSPKLSSKKLKSGNKTCQKSFAHFLAPNILSLQIPHTA